ncbi:polynucleotide kinase-phosphatase [Chitinophaga sp. Cy-1792]|uniref:polynucleotide kinase-phosphatase n=1 Tax=Chitinophaga sp. Cy-1792 TaxID=2608339 RepID=UPI00141FD9F3|nr:polynucleotide kinase-phosphatase [Chitinophaga sp. Cy-1792]NIG55101.1 polynucleotide kinase-phosphatase [Chitinophaga sp. Cy-1792]
MSKIKIEQTSLTLPDLSLVMLIGASGSGKSTFAHRLFKPTEIVSSDICRGLISDDENNQDVSADAFELARFIAGKRLKAGLLTVVDATNVKMEARKDWIDLAREHNVPVVAIVMNMPDAVCFERNDVRTDRQVARHVIVNQLSQLRRSLKYLVKDGIRRVLQLDSVEIADNIIAIEREKRATNKKDENGPFDIIGDVHGCYDELCALLEKLGYQVDKENAAIIAAPSAVRSNGETVTRKPVFVGDLVDRGPASPQVLRMVMNIVKNGQGLAVPGNHDAKLVKYLIGRNVQLRHGLEKTAEQLSVESDEFKEEVKAFIDGMVSHYVLDDGKLVVAHAGLREHMHGRMSGAVREFCLYGETTGEIDEFGLPVRYNWAQEYNSRTTVVYGHTPVPAAQWLNNTIDIDTGCVFGGALTALRYPEREIVAVPAKEQYAVPSRPIGFRENNILTPQQQADEVLDINEFIGTNYLAPRYGHTVAIREENSIAALEVMSRFGVNPKWMIYLPPTMSPAETSSLGSLLEHPAEGFRFYESQGVKQVICEEKHMGSRAIVIVCKDEDTALTRFGVKGEGKGVVYTRTGRAFFNEEAQEQAFIDRVNDALIKSGFYEKMETDWVCLDAELMPWSAKARQLLRFQYAATGAAATNALSDVVAALQQSVSNGMPAQALLELYSTKNEQAEKFRTAYRQYCWPVNSLDDYKLAPFHIMATEGKTYFDQTNEWHMNTIAEVCAADEGMLLATPYRLVEIGDAASEQAAIDWWTSLTAAGGEGMVIKPQTFFSQDDKDIIQPAVKIRGSEYLRIIYGPEYDTPANITRLRPRKLSRKRWLALREYALGLEALHLFTEKAPLQQVHKYVFGILALESEPIDPRL